VAPYAGHTSVIADYRKGQSLIETLLANGIDHVALTDWHSATDDMKDFDIDNYLADIVVVINLMRASSTGRPSRSSCSTISRWRRMSPLPESTCHCANSKCSAVTAWSMCGWSCMAATIVEGRSLFRVLRR
jgi:hypothetical protein